jgi:chromate reductase, NAD(P)H dehydrogenase (quinone)
VRILGIPGSLRRDSHNRRLLAEARALLCPDAELAVWGGLKSVPPFDEDDEPTPPAAVLELRRAIAAADGILIATPEYNSSLPGQLKNALDWASRPPRESVLHGKPVAVVGASARMFGGVWAQAEGRKVLSAIGARVIDREFAVPYSDAAFGRDGRLLDPELRDRLEGVLRQLCAAARLPEPAPVA